MFSEILLETALQLPTSRGRWWENNVLALLLFVYSDIMFSLMQSSSSGFFVKRVQTCFSHDANLSAHLKLTLLQLDHVVFFNKLWRRLSVCVFLISGLWRGRPVSVTRWRVRSDPLSPDVESSSLQPFGFVMAAEFMLWTEALPFSTRPISRQSCRKTSNFKSCGS